MSTVMEPSIPLVTLVELVPAEDITDEEIRTLDLSLEINYVKSKLQSQSVYAKKYDLVIKSCLQK